MKTKNTLFIAYIAIFLVIIGANEYYLWQTVSRAQSAYSATSIMSDKSSALTQKIFTELHDCLGNLNSLKQQVTINTGKIGDHAIAIDKFRDRLLRNTFFSKNVKKGDKILGWKVESVKTLDGAAAVDSSLLFPDNVSINLSGEESITGDSECVAAENIMSSGQICQTFCLSNLTVDSELKIPRYVNDKKDMEICFDANDFQAAGGMLSEESNQYTATINNLTLNYSSKDGYFNRAGLTKIEQLVQ